MTRTVCSGLATTERIAERYFGRSRKYAPPIARARR